MVNTSTNINKTNNHLSPHITEHKKDHDIMTLEIQVLVWNMHKDLAG
jgi:ribosomal protein S15P/S13E